MKHSLIILLFALNLSALTLQETLEIVESQNLELKSKNIDRELAHKVKNEKSAKRFGMLGIKGGYTKYNSPRALTPLAPPIAPNTPTSDEIYGATVFYSVTLFDGSGERSDVAVADIREQMSTLSLMSSVDMLLYNTQALYLSALSLKKKIYAKKLYIETLEKLHREYQERLKEGRSSRLDLLKIDSDLTKERSELKIWSHNLKILKYELANLMGRSDADFAVEDSGVFYKDKGRGYSLEKLVSYKISELLIAKREKELKKAKSSLYPKVTFDTGYTQNMAKGESGESFQGGIYFYYPIFDFGASSSKVEGARLSLLQSKLEHQKKSLEIEKELESAKLEIEKNKELLKSTEAELELIAKIEEIERLKLKEGRSTMQDYLRYLAQKEATVAKKLGAEYALIDSFYYFDFLRKER